MRSPLLALLLTAALLSGCVVEEADPETQGQDVDEGAAQSQAASEPAEEPAAQEPEQEDAPAGPHGTPVTTEGPITTGTNPNTIPGAWATRTVTVTNDFGGATLGDLTAAIAAGSISVRAADQEGYLVEAVLEARAATEADARALLERSHLDHSDVLEGATLFLEDKVRIDPAAGPPTPAPIDLRDFLTDGTLRVDLVITVPLAPAIDLEASSASGDITASDLHGPALALSTASGDIGLTLIEVADVTLSTASGDVLADGLVADSFAAETSSGDIQGSGLAVGSVRVSTASGDAYLEGAMDNIDAASSSGELGFDATPTASGSYALESASGDVLLMLPAEGAAYAVEASTASGDIFVDVPDGEVAEEDERHVEVASPGYEDAEVQTSIETSTSSGDITVDAE